MKNNSINMQKNIKSLKIVNYCRKIIAKLFSWTMMQHQCYIECSCRSICVRVYVSVLYRQVKIIITCNQQLFSWLATTKKICYIFCQENVLFPWLPNWTTKKMVINFLGCPTKSLRRWKILLAGLISRQGIYNLWLLISPAKEMIFFSAVQFQQPIKYLATKVISVWCRVTSFHVWCIINCASCTYY